MWETIGEFIGQVGFPIFVATWLLLKIGPEMKKLRIELTRLISSISTNTVVTAKSNGMGELEVAEIVRLVEVARDKGRRVSDRVKSGFGTKDE